MKKHWRFAAVTFLFVLPFNLNLGAVTAPVEPARCLPVKVQNGPVEPPKCDPVLQVCPKNE